MGICRNKYTNDFDIFSLKKIDKISETDKFELNLNNNLYCISASNFIKWLAIFRFEIIPLYPNTKYRIKASDRLSCYYHAKKYYNNQLIKDYELRNTLAKVWVDEYYRKHPHIKLNIYKKKLADMVEKLNNNLVNSKYSIINKDDNISNLKKNLREYQYIVNDLSNKLKINYFI
jgi:hypothetical protein